MTDDNAAWRGRVIDERYLVEDVLGRGGMGVVLRARHKFTGASVALKVLREELAQDAELQRRFLAEARAGNAIQHPGIVEVLDAGRDATGELYLAMELLVGESLRQPIARGALSATDVRRIGLELADALGAAHARGFVHRDLKPENVFLVAPHATVKLLDFGIAKVLASDVGTNAARTAAGVVMGTPAYMAPEQLKDARAVDARADLWAFGVMLYEMLAGRLPYRGATFEELFVAIATSDAAPITTLLPGAPPALDAFFARALARDPHYRFASSRELAAAWSALPIGAVATPSRGMAPLPQSVLASGFGSVAPGLAPTQMGSTAPPPQLQQPHAQLALAPGAAPVTQPPTAPASGGQGIWLGGAVGVAIAAVAIAYFATRPADVAKAPADAALAVAPPQPQPQPQPPPQPQPQPQPPPQPQPIDAAIAVASPQPQPAPQPAPQPSPKPPPKPQPQPQPQQPQPQPQQPQPQPRPPQPQPQPQPPPARSVADICASGCAHLTQCGVPNSVCKAQCTARPEIASCMADANNCNRVSACGFMIVCGFVPSGSLSCANVATAQSQCAFGDARCACLAAQHLAPNHALALAQLDGCVVTVGNICNGNLNCIAQRCGSQQTICMAQ